MSDNLHADGLKRINAWIEQLEDQTRRLLAAFQPEDLKPAAAAALAGKYITLIARLLELRQQFTNEASGEEERILSIIFGVKDEQLAINASEIDQ